MGALKKACENSKAPVECQDRVRALSRTRQWKERKDRVEIKYEKTRRRLRRQLKLERNAKERQKLIAKIDRFHCYRWSYVLLSELLDIIWDYLFSPNFWLYGVDLISTS